MAFKTAQTVTWIPANVVNAAPGTMANLLSPACPTKDVGRQSRILFNILLSLYVPYGSFQKRIKAVRVIRRSVENYVKRGHEWCDRIIRNSEWQLLVPRLHDLTISDSSRTRYTQRITASEAARFRWKMIKLPYLIAILKIWIFIKLVSSRKIIIWPANLKT